MKRSKAADLIDKLRQMAANNDGVYDAHDIGDLLAQYDLSPLEPCGGEAHSNAYIDSCSRCAPRWGFVGPKEPVT
jgi:hypothetical protein